MTDNKASGAGQNDPATQKNRRTLRVTGWMDRAKTTKREARNLRSRFTTTKITVDRSIPSEDGASLMQRSEAPDVTVTAGDVLRSTWCRT